MKKSTDLYRIILLVLGTIAAAIYILFFIREGASIFTEISFADITVVLLFAVFVAGYYFLWKNEIISGILLIAWHVIQWFLVLWIWPDGEMTILFGVPLGLFGIFVLIYGIRKRVASESKKKNLTLSLISLLILYVIFLFILSLQLGLWK
ncbi:MAG: hypothetical protein JSV22_08780 [Bacteroidales bacterium]|nr:MAG: hypothetical protein JSV22_08780 [Bacteroidales bacterium]